MAFGLLALLWLWGLYERHVEAELEKKYEPIPLPDNPTYSPRDVSIVVPTINTPDTLPKSLSGWLSNNPLEIILVTTPPYYELVKSLVSRVPEADGITQVVICDIANKREQLAKGLRMARGQIIGLVDDDAFWPKTTVLPYLLAGLEDPSVGGVQGKQSPYIPEERRNSNDITGWEVAGIRLLDIQNRIQAIRFAADGGCFCMVGRTMLLRASLLQDEGFLNALCDDWWAGHKLNTGDDCFISRWMMDKGWKFCIQNAPEAEILTLIHKDSKMLLQNVRWKRSSFQSCLTILFHCPGFRRFIRMYPYTGRKLVERLFTPVITWIHIWAWGKSLQESPKLTVMLLLWYVWGLVKSYRAFVQKYPFCAKKIWGAVLFDHCYPLLDLYGWLTVNREGWLTRRGAE